MADLSHNRGPADRRVRRTQASVRTTQAPSEQSRIVSRDVSKVVSSKEGSNLPAVFQEFFGGLSSAANTVAEAASIAKNYEIEQENETQRSMATADALAGRESRFSQQHDRDYVDTFDTVKGKRDGYGLADDYRKFLAGLPLDADPDAAKAEFLEAQFGSGTDSARYNEAAIATFEQQATAENTKFKQRHIAAVTQQVLRDHVATAADELNSGNMGPNEFYEAIETGVSLVGEDNRDAAMQSVIGGIVNGAEGPEAISSAISLLNAPGYAGTQSFAERFPEAAYAAEQKLLKRKLAIDTSASSDAYMSVERVVNAAVEAKDLSALLQAVEYLDKVHNTHGAEASYQRLTLKIDTALLKLAEDGSYLNEVHRLVGGGSHSNAFDGNKLLEASDTYLKQVVGQTDFLTTGDADDIAIAAKVAAALGGVSTNTKAYLEKSLRHPETAERVHQYLTQMDQFGRLKPSDVLSEDAFLLWQAGQALAGLGGPDGQRMSLGEAIQSVAEARYDFAAERRAIDYQTLMGRTSVAAAKAAVTEDVLKGVVKPMPGISLNSVHLGALKSEILNTFESALVLFQNTVGGGAKELALNAVIGKYQDRIGIAPGMDDSYVAHSVTYMNPNIPRFGEEVANGRGGTESTIDTYREDVEKLYSKFKFLSDDDEAFSAVPYAPGQARGTGGYLIHDGGIPVTFMEDRTYTIGDDRGDSTDIYYQTAEEILKTLPDGFGLTKVEDAGEDVYHLTYTPRFKDQRTLQQLEDEWTAPGLGQGRNRGAGYPGVRSDIFDTSRGRNR